MICNTYIQFLRTLADPSKFSIVMQLRSSPKSVSELAQGLRFEQSRVSHNLQRLKELNFVEIKKRGKLRIYHLHRRTIAPLLDIIDEHIGVYCRKYCHCKGEMKKKRWKGRI